MLFLYWQFFVATGAQKALSAAYTSNELIGILLVGVVGVMSTFEFLRRWGRWPSQHERQIMELDKTRKQLFPSGPAFEKTPGGQALEQIEETSEQVKKLIEKVDRIYEVQKSVALNQQKLTKVIRRVMNKGKDPFDTFGELERFRDREGE